MMNLRVNPKQGEDQVASWYHPLQLITNNKSQYIRYLFQIIVQASQTQRNKLGTTTRHKHHSKLVIITTREELVLDIIYRLREHKTKHYVKYWQRQEQISPQIRWQKRTLMTDRITLREELYTFPLHVIKFLVKQVGKTWHVIALLSQGNHFLSSLKLRPICLW